MLTDTTNDLANMPQQSFIKVYSEASNYLPETLDDSISEIDGQMRKDHTKTMRHKQPEKY